MAKLVMGRETLWRIGTRLRSHDHGVPLFPTLQRSASVGLRGHKGRMQLPSSPQNFFLDPRRFGARHLCLPVRGSVARADAYALAIKKEAATSETERR